MATAHKSSEHTVTNTLGVLLRAINPFKLKKTKTHEVTQKQPAKSASSAKSSTHKANPGRSAAQKSAKPSRKHKKQGAKKTATGHHRSPSEPAPTASENLDAESHAVMTGVVQDPAHAPGHRKMDVMGQFTEPTGEKTHIQASALEKSSRGDLAGRVTSPHRRINSPSRTASKRGTSLPKKSH